MFTKRRWAYALLSLFALLALGAGAIWRFRPEWVRELRGAVEPPHRWVYTRRPPEGPRLMPDSTIAELHWEAARPTAKPVRTSLPSGDIGTGHPLRVTDSAGDAGWVAFCQAREDTNGDGSIHVSSGFHGEVRGDRPKPFLAIGSGPGQPIGAFVAGDPSGRWVVILDKGQLMLIDTVNGVRERLASDEPARLRWLHRPRVANFDQAGRNLVYLDDDGPRLVAVVRDLASGEEWEVDHGPGELFEAFIADRWATVTVVEVGLVTQRNTTLVRSPCVGRIRAYGIYDGPRPTPYVASLRGPLSSGASRPSRRAKRTPGLVRPVGNGLLRQNYWDDMLLTVGDRTALLVGAECTPSLDGVDVTTGWVLFHTGYAKECTQMGNAEVFLHEKFTPEESPPWPDETVARSANGADLIASDDDECGAGSGFVCGPLRWVAPRRR